ncbi:unnamed protein product [Bursaphelenchus okinawaensis]|uniref:carnosine N-methyltransferase n=1 Tax=Bursaphelenchus okinawaensis TaxID=465554 RepID=A0A811K121_9BILA|nr:unnamed protein product [Bursaphelenchus okinawaensis]CAG9088534.1 unnamed protein product [Bursaphelenchus okinawaensis]
MNGECSRNPQQDAEAEVEMIGEVLSAMVYYERHAADKFRKQAKSLRCLDHADRIALGPALSEHLKAALKCAAENQKLFDHIINCGRVIFDDNSNYISAMNGLKEGKVPTEHYLSKARSTLKQITRDWSEEGREERESCYNRVIEAMRTLYPNKAERPHVNTLKHQFTIYPYVLDFSNCWTYSDALRPVKIPDVDPSTQLDNESRQNSFSMCAGDFTSAFDAHDSIFDNVVTVFFLDTAANPFKYIQNIKKILKPGGRWINFGPLTYHFEDSEDDSIELPFDILLQQIERYSFEIEIVEENRDLPSYYTRNKRSMLGYQYNCGFFQARLKTEEDSGRNAEATEENQDLEWQC